MCIYISAHSFAKALSTFTCTLKRWINQCNISNITYDLYTLMTSAESYSAFTLSNRPRSHNYNRFIQECKHLHHMEYDVFVCLFPYTVSIFVLYISPCIHTGQRSVDWLILFMYIVYILTQASQNTLQRHKNTLKLQTTLCLVSFISYSLLLLLYLCLFTVILLGFVYLSLNLNIVVSYTCIMGCSNQILNPDDRSKY